MRKVEFTEKEAALVGRIVESELRDQISERRRAKEKRLFFLKNNICLAVWEPQDL